MEKNKIRIVSGLFVFGVILFFIAVGGFPLFWKAQQEQKKVSDAVTTQQALEAVNRINIHISTKQEILSYVGDEAIFGYTEAELLNQSIELLIPKGMYAKHDASIGRRFAINRTANFVREIECIGKRKDGSGVRVTATITVFPEENKNGVRATAWFTLVK